MFDRLPPSAPELEEAVLGAVMLEKNAFINVVSYLKPEHFYLAAHRTIYQACINLFGDGDPVDMRSCVAQLRKDGTLESVGGAYKIAELTSKVSSAANLDFHSRIIIEFAIKRGLIEIGAMMQKEGYDETIDVFDIVQRTTVGLQDLLDKGTSDRAERSAKDLAVDFLRSLDLRMAGKTGGISTGFPALDKILGGLMPADLYLIAARPSMGKSAMAFQIAKQVAATGVAVGVFSLEMSAQQIVERLICSESEVDSDLVRRGQLDGSGFEYQRLYEKTGIIGTLPLYVDDSAALSMVELRARAMRMYTKHKVRIIIVDYLQMIKGHGQTRDQEIGNISRTLKQVAKELNIPVIALSSLNRGVESRGGDKRPMLSDLRESGNLESDADVVMFLYRPEYYKILEDSDGMPTSGLCEVIIAKHRNGSVDTVKLKFIGKYTKFKPWEQEAKDNPFSGMMTRENTDQFKYKENHYKDPSMDLNERREEVIDNTPEGRVARGLPPF